MKLARVDETLTNLEIAHRQLERAIDLFMGPKDYVSALTLAGAAEEILGKLLNKRGQTHWLDEITSGALGALGFVDAEADSPEAKAARKEIANLANFYKNRCKHFSEVDQISFPVDVKAAEMIDRAVSNYWDLTNRETGAMGRFREVVLRYGGHGE
ncbi:hypothetical protein [Undibacterium sp. WLX3042]|uniref:hypothetical protein n=1 Tax=Undibacterium sp. WLX3042 TaxID=3412686 RepID=UPI003C3069EA